MRPLLLGLLAASGTLSVSPGDAVAGEKETPTSDSVVLFGSSSMNDSFGHVMAADLEQHGYKVLRRGYAAAGLSRPDFRDMVKESASLPLENGAAVIVYLGGNDAQALWLRPEERSNGHDAWIKWDDPRWSEDYRTRVTTFVDAMCNRGARAVIVLPPVDVESPRMQRRLDRIRRLQDQGASASRCGKVVPTRGDSRPMTHIPSPLRAPDGIHMSRDGAIAVWKRVASEVLRVLSGRPQRD